MKPDRKQTIFGVDRTLSWYKTEKFTDYYQFYDKSSDLWYTYCHFLIEKNSPIFYLNSHEHKKPVKR